MTPAWLLAAVFALPIYKEDREAANKAEQLELVARAITVAATEQRKWPGAPGELKAVMLTVARYESGLSLRIHAGDCKPTECDRGKARGLWQQQAISASSPDAWERLAGLDEESTLHAAREAARAITRARWQCRSLETRGEDWVPMVFSAYAGRGCIGWFRGRDERVAMFRKLLGRS